MTEILGKIFNKKIIVLIFCFIICFSIVGIFAEDGPSGEPNQLQQAITDKIRQYKDSASRTDAITVPLLQEIFGYVPQAGLKYATQNFVLESAFYGFNIGIAALGAALIVYAVLLGLTNTVSSGQPLGQRLHTLFFPMRIAIGSIGLAPIFGGYSLSQVFALWCIVQGVGFADLVWNMSITAFLDNYYSINIANKSDNTSDDGSSALSASALLSFQKALNVQDVNRYELCNKFSSYLSRNEYSFSGLGIESIYFRKSPSSQFYEQVINNKYPPYYDLCGTLKTNIEVNIEADALTTTVCSKVTPAAAQKICQDAVNSAYTAYMAQIMGTENAWSNIISSTWNNTSDIPNNDIAALIKASSFMDGSTVSAMCKSAESGYTWAGFLCQLGKVQKTINDSADSQKKIAKIKEKLQLGWLFAAPNYFSLNDTDGNVDIVTKFVNNFSIIYTQPSGDESLPIALSGQCANENITNSSLSKLGANFNSEFNSRFNQYFKSGSSLNFLQLPTQSPGFISSNVSRDIILGKSFKLNELPFNRVFFAKVACQLCKDSNSQNMASKNMSFSDYVTSNNTPNICSAAIKEELTNCYNEDKGWNDPGKLEGLQNAISEKNFAIDVQFSDLLVLLNIASSSKSPVASSNIFQQFGGSQSTDSGSNQQDKSSISYIRNQYECYIKGKWNAYMDIINNDLANQGVAPPPSSEELGKISDIFSKSNLNKMLEQSSFSLGGLNFGVGAVMTMLGSIVSLFAEDIVSPQSNNILSIIQNTSPFPLIGISKKGNEIAQKMEEIVQWMIPGYPLILGGKKLIDLIANIKVQDGSNFWDTITKMFAGIGAVVGVVAGIFLATQSGAWKVISKILEFQLYALMLVIAIAAPFYMAALTMFYLPIIPVVIFMYAIFAWFMTVVEAVVAAPILAIGLMHPSGQDEVFGKSEVGLLMLINAMLRPMLIIIGFVSAFIFFKIAFVIYNLFFGAMLNYLEITSIGAYITFVGSYVGGMIPLVTRVYGLTNQIPENVMTWIGGTHAGSRGEATEALQGSRAGAQAAPGEAAGLGKAAAGSGAAFAQAGVGLYDSIKNSPASKGNEPKPK